MKNLLLCALILACVVVWAAAGYTAGREAAITDAEFAAPHEQTVVEVPVEKQWDKSLLLGVLPDGSIAELDRNEDQAPYAYIVEIFYSAGGGFSEVYVQLDFGDAVCVLFLGIPASEYHVSVRQQAPIPQPESPKPAPKPEGEQEDDF